jgi:hypothetical protein
MLAKQPEEVVEDIARRVARYARCNHHDADRARQRRAASVFYGVATGGANEAAAYVHGE